MDRGSFECQFGSGVNPCGDSRHRLSNSAMCANARIRASRTFSREVRRSRAQWRLV